MFFETPIHRVRVRCVHGGLHALSTNRLSRHQLCRLLNILSIRANCKSSPLYVCVSWLPSSTVTVRFLKHDLFFVMERLVFPMDKTVSRCGQRSTVSRQKRNEGGIEKTFEAFIGRADEGTFSCFLVERASCFAASGAT